MLPLTRFFNVASLYRTVTPSQEALNDMMEEDEVLPTPKQTEPNQSIGTTTAATSTSLAPPTTTTIPSTRPKEQRQEKKKPAPVIPAKDLGLVVHASEARPFPDTVTYEHLKDHIVKEKYKITYTADKSLQEIIDLISNNQIKFLDTDLKEEEESTYKKIRPGKEEKSPLHKLQSKKSVTKPWQ